MNDGNTIATRLRDGNHGATEYDFLCHALGIEHDVPADWGKVHAAIATAIEAGVPKQAKRRTTKAAASE